MSSAATCAKYGLTLLDWLLMAERQGWACAICGRVPRTGRLVIDHEHVRGFKKLPPEERRRCVRGLLCWTCNRDRVARNDLASAVRVMNYLAGNYSSPGGIIPLTR